MISTAPIKIDILVPTTLTVKSPRLVPYKDFTPLREWFDLEALKKKRPYHKNPTQYLQLAEWMKARKKNGDDREIMELHLPTKHLWNLNSKHLVNPDHKIAIACKAGKNFHKITGHPDNSGLYVIKDEFYRQLTWRSITMRYWNRREPDNDIEWDVEGHLVYFLYKCQKLNKEPTKSTLINKIGSTLIERDKPKPQEK